MENNTPERMPLVRACQIDRITLCNVNFDGPDSSKSIDHGVVNIHVNTKHEIDKEQVPPRYVANLICKVRAFQKDDEQAATNDKDALVSLDITYRAEYRLTQVEDWPSGEMDHFDVNCALYHVWPYLRELSHNLTARGFLSPVLLPMVPRDPLNPQGRSAE